MNEQQQTLEELQHIKKMMERSSRFISLSGLSGIAAGACALVGAWFANNVIVESGGPSGYRQVYPFAGGGNAAGFYGASAFSNCRSNFFRGIFPGILIYLAPQ